MPLTWVTWFLRNRYATPLEILAETWRDRSMMAPKSNDTSAALTPKSPARRHSSSTSAERSRALVGMQPQLRHTPPRLSRSMQATLSPSWAARMAQT